MMYLHVIYSTFANGEVKEFKEVREVKAICFIAKYTTKKAILIQIHQEPTLKKSGLLMYNAHVYS